LSFILFEIFDELFLNNQEYKIFEDKK